MPIEPCCLYNLQDISSAQVMVVVSANHIAPHYDKFITGVPKTMKPKSNSLQELCQPLVLKSASDFRGSVGLKLPFLTSPTSILWPTPGGRHDLLKFTVHSPIANDSIDNTIFLFFSATVLSFTVFFYLGIRISYASRLRHGPWILSVVLLSLTSLQTRCPFLV